MLTDQDIERLRSYVPHEPTPVPPQPPAAATRPRERLFDSMTERERFECYGLRYDEGSP